MDPAVKTLKAALEAIRNMALNALHQKEQSREQCSMRWKCNDIGEPLRDTLVPHHTTPRHFINRRRSARLLSFRSFSKDVGPSCFARPRRILGVFPFKIRKAFDRYSLFRWEFEIDVLKLVVKADLVGVRQSCAEIHPINPRPIDGAHTPRAGSAIHVKVAPFRLESSADGDSFVALLARK